MAKQTRRSLLHTLGLSLLGGAVARATTAARSFDVRAFGARGDGTTPDTPALQRAIDAAAAAGGGVVQFPRGVYVTGTVLLRSNVTLDLSADATISGSLNPADYRLVEPFVDGVGTTRGYALIAAVDAHAVEITGSGTIDGRGAALQAAAAAAGGAGSKAPEARPFLVLWVRSTAVAVSGVRLLNSSAWTMHIFQCADVVVSRVAIHSTGLANNDGIDTDSSQRVLIESCTIESDDDAICLKTTSALPCREITVRNCTLVTRCGAVKLGTESFGDFSAIRVSDCHVLKANLGAIKILSVDGARISDVLVERIRVDDADTPIFVRLGARGRTYRKGDAPRPVGTISGIIIRDVEVRSARRIGVLVSGLPEHPIEDVTLERISMLLSGDAVREVPAEPAELPAAYPEVRMFGANLPAYGIYARHVRRLPCREVTITRTAADARPEHALSEL